jgi:hypothetical protein
MSSLFQTIQALELPFDGFRPSNSRRTRPLLCFALHSAWDVDVKYDGLGLTRHGAQLCSLSEKHDRRLATLSFYRYHEDQSRHLWLHTTITATRTGGLRLEPSALREEAEPGGIAVPSI